MGQQNKLLQTMETDSSSRKQPLF